MADLTLLSNYMRTDDFASADLSQLNFGPVFRAGALALLGLACSPTLQALILPSEKQRIKNYEFTSQVISHSPSKLTEEDRLDREFYGVTELEGPLKTVVIEESHFSAKPNELGQYVEVGRKHIKKVFFDKDGKVTGAVPEAKRCGTEDSLKTHRTEIYDARGEKKGAVEEAFDVNGTLRIKVVYEFDSEGRTRAYNWTIYDGLGSISAKVERKNDAQGNMIESSIYGKYGFPTSKDIYIRNEKGLVMESLGYASGSLVNRETISYEYDTIGNWVKRTKSKFVTEDGISFFTEK